METLCYALRTTQTPMPHTAPNIPYTTIFPSSLLHIDWLSIVCCPLLCVCVCVCGGKKRLLFFCGLCLRPPLPFITTPLCWLILEDVTSVRSEINASAFHCCPLLQFAPVRLYSRIPSFVWPFIK